MEDIIWARINKLETNDLNFIHYYKIDVDVDYSDVEILYKNYLSKYYFDSEASTGIFTNNEADKVSLKLSLFEPALSLVLEELFQNSIKRLDDDLILFYIKEKDTALILFKSFYPLSQIDEVRLPHFCYYIKNNKTIDYLKKLFQDEETLCLMYCSNN
jgi:hypothetical protein